MATKSMTVILNDLVLIQESWPRLKSCHAEFVNGSVCVLLYVSAKMQQCQEKVSNSVDG